MKSLTLKEIHTKVEALEKEIRLHRSILEVVPDPFFILDLKGDFPGGDKARTRVGAGSALSAL